MSMITVFLILLVAAFATIVFFTEPSEADKRIQERLSGLDRHVSRRRRPDGDFKARHVQSNRLA